MCNGRTKAARVYRLGTHIYKPVGTVYTARWMTVEPLAFMNCTALYYILLYLRRSFSTV